MGAGNGMRPHAFQADAQGDVACGVCRVTHSSLGTGWHALHVVMVFRVAIGATRSLCDLGLRYRCASAPLVCPAVQHPKWVALEPAVQLDSGLLNRVVRLGGRITGDVDLHCHRGFWYG